MYIEYDEKLVYVSLFSFYRQDYFTPSEPNQSFGGRIWEIPE